MKKNIVAVISSNLLTLFVSLFMGFIVPKYMSVDDYAYYRIYMLYIVYAGFFHLGIVNGIYLKYGDHDVDQLPVGVFKKYSLAMFAIQFVMIALLFSVLAIFWPKDVNVGIAYAFTIVNIPLMNIKWFYSSINQFTRRFVIDSAVTYAQNIMQAIMVLLVMVLKLYQYQWILAFVTSINFLCMLAVIMQNHQFLGIPKHNETPSGTDAQIVPLIKNGFFFMISEFVAIIILGIDSVFVQNLFTLNEFAMYSFAVSIISVMYSLISTISNLIYPYLVRVNASEHAKYYTLMSNILSMIGLYAMLAFFPAKWIVLLWIDKFTPSLIIAATLFGTVVFRTLIMLVGGNFFKVLKMTKAYTVNNFFAIALAFVLNLIAYFAFHQYTYIAYASLVSFVIWYVVTDLQFIRKLKLRLIDVLPRYIAITICLSTFYLLMNANDYITIGVYLPVVTLICLLCYRPQIKNLWRMIHERKKNKTI